MLKYVFTEQEMLCLLWPDTLGCLAMEEKSPKYSCAKEEVVPASVTMERNNDQDAAGSVSGTVTAAATLVLTQ